MTAEARLAAALGDTAAGLTRLARDADDKLLAAGEGLGALVGILEGLTRQFEALPRELEDAALREATLQLERLAREIAALARALGEEKEALAGLAALSLQTGAGIQQLRKTVHAIAMLAVNAQIEAAHVDGRGEDFTVFARDIVRLARTAQATAEGYGREHERLTRILQAASEAQAGFSRAHEATLHSAGEQLRASLATLETRRAEAASAAAEIGRRSKRISQEIGAAVMGLQIGDITRQRLEHVGEALHQLSAGLELGGSDGEGPAWSTALDAETKAAVAAALGRMQSAQLSRAAAEFGGELARITASLKQLAEEGATIVRLGAELYGAGDRQSGSFLEDLRANLTSAGALVRASQAARDEVDAAIGSLGESLRHLLERLASVRSIEIDMRLVGLNTALRCGRLGEDGRTLNVVAQELRGYANQTVQDADRLVAALREVADAAERFERERQDRGADRIAAMEQAMTTWLAPFEESGARLGGALSALAENGGRVSATLHEIAAAVAAQDALGGAIRDAGDRIAGMVRDIAADTADPEVVRERVAAFAGGRYTMQSERDIHAEFAAGPSDGAAQAPRPEAPASIDDLLF